MRTRTAFTLLELLLTIAVMAALASVLLPQIGFLLGDRRLVRGANQVRVEMVRLRIEAMRSGKTLMLQGLPGESELRIQPFASLADATETMNVTGTSALLAGADQAAPATFEIERVESRSLELPEEVLFASVNVVSSARAIPVEQSLTAAAQADDYSQPVLFYADGTTSTAMVTLQHTTMGSIRIKLRGITGDATVGDVFATTESVQ
ncbi:MAG: type II secretion system protein [Planctomycetota bacterium]